MKQQYPLPSPRPCLHLQLKVFFLAQTLGFWQNLRWLESTVRAFGPACQLYYVRVLHQLHVWQVSPSIPKTAMSSLCPCSVLPKACLGSCHWLVLPWLQGTVGAGWSLFSSTLTLQIEPCQVLSSLQKEAYFQPLLQPQSPCPF